jgi:spermidine synthase
MIGDLYTKIAGTGQANLFLRAIVAGIMLIPPTLLMGATLPAIARWVESTPSGVAWLGYFYGGNLAGAVVGSLVAGFYLLRVYDMPKTTYVRRRVERARGAAGARHRVAHEGRGWRAESESRRTTLVPGARLVYAAIALSGLTAMGAQVVWTRMLSLLLGATTYTFSLILAVFLVGLGIGSSLGAAVAKGSRNPRIALGWTQVGLCVALAWAAYATGASLPFWPINPSISTSLAFNFQLDLMRGIWVMLPGAILWGMSFPLALASVAERGQGPRAAGWRRLRGQHPGRHHRRAGDRPDPCRLGRDADDPADPDRHCCAIRPADADAWRGRVAQAARLHPRGGHRSCAAGRAAGAHGAGA